jgi:hypothetical protein
MFHVKHDRAAAYNLAGSLVGLATFAIMAKHGEQIASIIQSVVDDERCVHCGYRKDHPIVVHGPPCLAKNETYEL